MTNSNNNLIQHDKKTNLRLNKYISDFSNYSRRQADKLIQDGKVTVNGVKAIIGTKVDLNDKVIVNKKLINPVKNNIYIALNKPIGITSTTDNNIPGNLTTFMNYKEMIFPIGRLDKDSSGLLLMTNDGDIVNKILREEYGHDKEYIVTVNKKITNNFITQMEKGVNIYNPVSNKYQKTKPCTVKKINDNNFKIILQQGLNRQIRRMTKKLGYKVTKLQRTRIMNIYLGNLEEGSWRYLTDDELVKINYSINKNKKLK